ncbi:Putative WAK family receptor-like protein kinase [Zea mays]|uniref:Putative WAK family receptor-like protein kinase n=1 Tax=Zea mays TaxID=4577 RepID=A0A1D6LT63_MAIZE|nr:Putative WAK family receptor-like protein kinase [Zea mays]
MPRVQQQHDTPPRGGGTPRSAIAAAAAECATGEGRSSSEDDGDAAWKAAIDSIASVGFSVPSSNGMAKAASSSNDEVNNHVDLEEPPLNANGNAVALTLCFRSASVTTAHYQEDSTSAAREVQSGVYRPFQGNVEVLNISLINGTIRELNPVSTHCYNSSSGSMEPSTWSFDASKTPYRFSDVQNKFTVIGCQTLAYITDNTDKSYQSGCVSMCQNVSDLMDGSCSGMGCCQTDIPKKMGFYNVSFDCGFDTSQISRLGLGSCSYAMLMEAEEFSFSTTYIINMTAFNDTNSERVPVVMDWAIRDGALSCELARRNETGTYACRNGNNKCVDSPNGPGYLCNCSGEYEGNPYLPNGCHDVDECKNSPCPSVGGVCHNTFRAYKCSCRAGRKLNKQNNTCDPNTTLITGVTIGFLVLVIFSSFGYMILQKRKLNQVKQEHFRQHGGIILFERMRSENGLAFTVFSEVELVKAIDSYDKSRIIGKGGHGTVYKGIVKGNVPIAIKRCALIDERQKKEFGQEMLILSQINHKNIVKLEGCCLEVEIPMLVCEFVPNGTLYELIHGKNQALQIPFSTLLRIAHEAAEGLSFLHSCEM